MSNGVHGPALPTVKLMPREDRRLRGGHCWVYSTEIEDASEATDLIAGASVRVVDSEGRTLGSALWNPASKLRARIFDRGESQFESQLPQRLAQALALRERIFAKPHYRLVYGESDGLPSLTVDRYGDLLVAQLASYAIEAHAELLRDALLALPGVSSVVFRHDASVRGKEGLAAASPELFGAPLDSPHAQEGGLRFAIDPLGGMKGGWFWDQRGSRNWFAGMARGQKVLDLFCHTGGFGIRAAAAGASEMLGLDRSGPALTTARANAKAARLDRSCRFQEIDLFGGAGARGWPKGSWDLVVLDPPALCKGRGEVEAALGAYDHLNRKAAGRVAHGGILLSCSCTSPVTEEVWQGTVLRALRRAGRSCRILYRGGQGADHPVLPGMPETRYLKVLAIELS